MEDTTLRTWQGSAPEISANRERARMLAVNSPIATLSSLANAAILIGILSFGGVSAWLLAAWAACVGGALGFRLWLVRRYDADVGEEAHGRWLRVFTVSALISGSVWGLAGVGLFFVSDMVQAAVILFVLAGMTAGAATALRPYPDAAAAFIVAAIVPAIVFFASRGTLVSVLMAGILVMYIALMISIARKGGNGIARMIGYADEAHKAADKLQIIADYTYAWEGWVDPNGKVQWVNPSVERVTGYTPEECYAMPDYPFCLMHPEDVDRVKEIVREFRREIKPARFEFRLLRKDGAVRWCEGESAPAYDRDGNHAGFRASTRDVHDAVQMREELQRLATTDPLTGAHNRRHFFELAERELYTAARHGRSLVVAIFDIDHFKKINDRHGHAAGDECLRAFVETINASVRKSDVLARFGGEEFVLLMPETSLYDAEMLCNRLREKVAEMVVGAGEDCFTCTVSIGLTDIDANTGSIDEAIAQADKALYEAKSAGRNRVVVRGDPVPLDPPAPVETLRALAR